MKNLIFNIALALLPLGLFAQDLIKQEYYDNGNLKSQIYTQGSSMLVMEYYENGTLKERGTFTEDKKNIKYLSWYSDGSKCLEVSFSDNVPDGKWKMWNEEGLIIGEASYQNGKLIHGAIFNDMGETMASR